MDHETTGYQLVLHQLLQKIKQTRQQTKTRQKTMNLVYSVPTQMPNNAQYNLKKCLIFIIKKLRDHNFSVHYKHPNLLIINIHIPQQQKTPQPPQQQKKPPKKRQKQQKNIKITDPSILNIIHQCS